MRKPKQTTEAEHSVFALSKRVGELARELATATERATKAEAGLSLLVERLVEMIDGQNAEHSCDRDADPSHEQIKAGILKDLGPAIVAEVERLKALEKDRERLDWLEKIGFSTTNSSSEYAPGVHCWRDKDGWGWTAHWISSECKTAREAIDAAIAQAGTEVKPNA